MSENKLLVDFKGALGDGNRCIVILQPNHPDFDIEHLKALRDVLFGQGRTVRYIVDDVTGFADDDTAYDVTAEWLNRNDLEIHAFLDDFQRLRGAIAMAPIHEYSKQTLKAICDQNPDIKASLTRMATERVDDPSNLEAIRTAREDVFQHVALLMTIKVITGQAEAAPVVCNWFSRNDYHTLIEKNNGALGQYLPIVATAEYSEDRLQPEPEDPRTGHVLTLRPHKG